MRYCSDLLLYAMLGTAGGEGVYTHTCTPALAPVSREEQFRRFLAAGYDLVVDDEARTVTIHEDGFELVWIGRRACKAARRALAG